MLIVLAVMYIQTPVQTIAKSDMSIKIIIGTFIITLILFAKYLKSESYIHPVILAILCTTAVAVAIYYNDTKDLLKKLESGFDFDLNSLNPFASHTKTPSLKSQIRQKLYEEYANADNNEVYFPGSDNVKMYANAAGVSLTGLWMLPKNFVCIVFTDQIIKIQDYEDDAQTTWNNIYHGHMYPILVYLNNKTYYVYCHCMIKEIETTLFDTVTCPDGKTYHICQEYRHMNKNDAMYVFNHAPFLSYSI